MHKTQPNIMEITNSKINQSFLLVNKHHQAGHTVDLACPEKNSNWEKDKPASQTAVVAFAVQLYAMYPNFVELGLQLGLQESWGQ